MYLSELLNSTKKTRIKFYHGLVDHTLAKIACAQDLRTLHICTPIHHEKALELRKTHRAFEVETINKRRALLESATRLLAQAKLRYAELRVEKEDDNPLTERARIDVEHYKRLKSQRLRRLKEAKEPRVKVF